MTPFAIAGTQMPISVTEENLGATARRLDLLVTRYPRVRMAVVSELAASGPLVLARRPAIEARPMHRPAS
jgi:hypothetical protein